MGIKTIPKIVRSLLSSDRDLRDKTKRFRSLLMRWARKHERDFPWRHTSDPFKTLIAEIMLQRTRSPQVAPIYKRFIGRYPNPAALADARPDELAAIVRRLGLGFRARALGELARILMEEHRGKVPLRAEEAIRLPGVGPYVASALDAFLLRRRIPVIDANVARVLGRVFGIGGADWRWAKAKERRAMYEIAWMCVGRANPRAYHYALLDFAATVCAPRSPACPDCPMHRARICAYCEDTSSTLRENPVRSSQGH